MTSFSTIAAAYALGATAVAVSLVVLLHRLEPEFDPSWRMLSEYSLGRYGVLMRMAFLAAGTAVIAAGLALSPWAWPTTLGLFVVALGPLGATVVDTDPITMPRTEMSARSNVHAALGSVFILGFPAAATIAGIGAAGDPAVGVILAVASIAPWVGLAWFLARTIRSAPPDGRGGPDVRIGWPNRIAMLVYMAWVALAALLVLT